MFSSSPPFQLGQTQLGTHPTTDELIGQQFLGQRFEFPNKDYSSSSPRTNSQILSGKNIRAVCLRNVSGGALSGKLAGACDVGQSGSDTYGLTHSVSGLAASPNGGRQVVIDPYLSSGGVADDYLFWGILRGVVPMTLPATSGWTGGDIEVGDVLQATTGGKVVRATGRSPIDIERFRVWDAYQTSLPGTAATDDLAVLSGGITAFPVIQGIDFGGTTTTAYGRCRVRVPDDYKPGSYLAVGITGGMMTSVADTSCTVDLDVRTHSGTGVGVGSDLVTTTAQSINSLTFAEKTFLITPTDLVPGSILDLRITVAGSDGANAAVMLPTITKVELIYGLSSVSHNGGCIIGRAVEAKDEATHADGTILVDVDLDV